MKGLIKNYLNKLSTDKLNKFAISKDIYLSNSELEYLLKLAQDNFDDIIVNEDKYLNLLKDKLSSDNYDKIKKLYTHYKNKYKGYLF